ncbi:MAG: ATP-binding protein [Mariniblastus sp.]
MPSLTVGLSTELLSNEIDNGTTIETPYAKICREELAVTEQGSEAFLLAKFKLTNALRFWNLSAALENANEAVRWSKEIGDPDYSAVALAQIATIESFLDGRSRTKQHIDISTLQISKNACSELKLLFHSSILDLQHWSGSIEDSIVETLDRLVDASNSLSDERLINLQKSQELFIRRQSIELKSSEERLAELASFLTNDQSNYLDSRTVLAFESNLKKTQDKSQRLQAAYDALEFANASKNRVHVFHAHFMLGRHFAMAKKFEKAKNHFHLALHAATALEMQPLIYSANCFISEMESKLNRPEKQLEILETVVNSKAFDDLSLGQRNRHIQQLWSLHTKFKNDSKAIDYREKMLPPEFNNDIAEMQKNAKQESEKRYAIEKIAEKDRELFETKQLAQQAKFESLVAQFQLLASLVAFALIAGVGILLIRKRLRSAKIELASEREVTRQTRQQCADLSLRLSRIQRMESLGLMAGSVAHDFNNILVGVLGNAEVLQMKNHDSDEEFRDARITSIISSAEKAASLSKQMLAYAGKQNIERKTLDLNELISHYESILSSTCKNHELKFELSDQQTVSKVDLIQIEQVVLNLVSNATAASPEGSRVTIRTGHETIDYPSDPQLYGVRESGGAFCYIEVTDKGSGISKSEMERIFEPFYSNSELNSRGLGLSVVYGVIKGHDGLIRCTSKIDQGTTFRVLLPASIETSVVPLEKLNFDSGFDFQPENSTSTRSLNILVIDDDETVIELCEQSLNIRTDWNVIPVHGGVAGLEQIKQRYDEIDCILLDVMMPEMGANELLRELEAEKINTPVVLMSGFSQTKLDFFLQKPQVVTIVQKPFRVAELHAAIELATENVASNSQIGAS